MVRFSVPFIISLLCACATTPQKHAFSDTSSLILGKTTPAECKSLFGEPKESDIKNSSNGKIEVYRYLDRAERWGKLCGRALILEFKSDVLNGYLFASSFEEDRTTFAVTNITKIEWAASAREDVAQILGKPHGKFRCPTTIIAQDRCRSPDREVWFYANFQPVPLMTPIHRKMLFAGETAAITFDEHGIVIEVNKSQAAPF
jgi:hypothetical protein